MFGKSELPTLCRAVYDLSWLESRGYPPDTTLKLVGDRYRLKTRQRDAVRQSSCSDEALETRTSALAPLKELRGESLSIDGFNLLITLEAAFGGGVVIRGRDRCMRDLSSVHGTYRQVEETERAARLVGEVLSQAGAREVHWLLDRPVSNSGRLRAMLAELGEKQGWPWTVELDYNPDHCLMRCNTLVVTNDAVVLDAEVKWVNLAAHVIQTHIPQAWVIDLAPPCGLD